MNFVRQILQHKGKIDQREIVGYKDKEGKWVSYNFDTLYQKIQRLSNALKKLNVQIDEKVAIFSQNMPEWTISDLAIINNGAVTVPIYATNTTDQAEYILKEAETRIIFAGDQEQYDKILEIQTGDFFFDKIIVFKDTVELKTDNSVFIEDITEGESIEFDTVDRKPSDLATLIYTSGTTGEPKGVMHTHQSIAHGFTIHEMRFKFDPAKEHSFCFLPLTHVFERAWTLFCLSQGVKVSFLETPKTIVDDLKLVKPTMLCAVPRLYQKAYYKIYSKIEKSSLIKRKIFNMAYKVGKKYHAYLNEGKKIPKSLQFKYNLADKKVFSAIKEQFGGNLSFMPVGGAALSSDIIEFFGNIGMPFIIGYGLTETLATVTCHDDQHVTYSSVGSPMPTIEVKLGLSDEILVKGKSVMAGYYKKPEETAKVFTEDGWFRTGDVGSFNENGELSITDRIKDLMKTSYGKYITPQPIEALLSDDNLIEHVVLIGDNRPFVTALIVPNFEELKDLSKKINIKFESVEHFLNLDEVKEHFHHKVEDMQKNLAEYEKVKKIKILMNELSMELGELTPTLKVKRKVLTKKFSKMIDEMYNKKN